MKRWTGLLLGCALAAGAIEVGHAQTAELDVLNQAVAALGGKEKVMGAKSLKIIGYGQIAYQDGGGNISSTPDAPQKWINISAHQRVIDLEHGRMNVQQRNIQDFVFAYARNMNGDIRVNNSLDGDVAFTVGADGKAARVPEAAVRARRLDMLNNPVSIVRAAFDPATKLGKLRKQDNLQVLDLTTRQGDQLVLAFNSDTHLPAWLSWVAPHPNFGDVTYRTHFAGYQPLDGNGLVLPSGYNTISDFRNVVQQKIYVDKYVVNGTIPDLAAPADVRSAAAPVPGR